MHIKKIIYTKKLTHQDRKIKISATRLAKTKQKGAHQKDHLYKKLTHQDRKIKISALRLAKQQNEKDLHQKEHLDKKITHQERQLHLTLRKNKQTTNTLIIPHKKDTQKI